MNTKMLTVEDANSILEHFGRGFIDYYVLDTRILESSEFWFAYDFMEIYQSEGSIQFNIQNNLWTKAYYIADCNINDYSVSVSGNMVTITGTGLEWVVFVLEISPDFSHNNYTGLDYIVEYTPVMNPCFGDMELVVKFKDFTGDAVSNLEVYDLMKEETVVTDSNGELHLSIPYSLPSGKGIYSLECEHTQSMLQYNFVYEKVLVNLPVVREPDNPLFKNRVNTVSFRWLYDNEHITPDILYDENDIQLTVGDNVYNDYTFDGDVFSFTVDLTGVVSDYISLVLSVDGNDYLASEKLTFMELLTYFTTDNVSVLQSEISDSTGARVIIFTGDDIGECIVDRDVELRFDGVVTSGSLTVADGRMDLITPHFSNVPVIVNDAASLTVDSGIFEHTEDIVIRNNGTGSVTVKDSAFLDNYSCISSKVNVSLMNCSFELGDNDYLDTRTVAFVECLGDLSIDYCTFNLNLSVPSVGFGYVFFKLSVQGSVNSISGGNLLVNQSFPVLKNVSDLVVDTDRFRVRGKSNKCIVWTVEDTNTVYSNDLVVEYV